LTFAINGGIKSLDMAKRHLAPLPGHEPVRSFSLSLSLCVSPCYSRSTWQNGTSPHIRDKSLSGRARARSLSLACAHARSLSRARSLFLSLSLSLSLSFSPHLPCSIATHILGSLSFFFYRVLCRVLWRRIHMSLTAV